MSDDFKEVTHPCFKVLVCGRTGVGKSSLINNLFGREVFEVHDPASGTNEGTTEVKRLEINGVSVEICESPGNGIQDSFASEWKDIHLFLYCMDMTVPRFGSDEIETMWQITRKFRADIWKRCLLVMTKANAVPIPPDIRRNKGERLYFQRFYGTLLRTFEEELVKQGVTDVAIPACEAGLCYEDGDESDRNIWYVSNTDTWWQFYPIFNKPSEQPMDFLTELWVMCLERISDSESRIIFWNCTEHRVQLDDAYVVSENMKGYKESKPFKLEQRLHLKPTERHYQRLIACGTVELKNPPTATQMAVKVGGCAIVGAATGGAIGVVAGGAAVGLMAGTAVGSAVGAASGYLYGKK